MRSYLLVLWTVLMASCTDRAAIPTDAHNHTSIQKDTTSPPTPLVFPFHIDSTYHYCCEDRAAMNKWWEQLSTTTKDSIRDQLLTVHKTYYIANALFNERIKYHDVLAYDRALENHLYAKIGLRQGLPMAVFATAMVPSEEAGYQKKEWLLIKLNAIDR